MDIAWFESFVTSIPTRITAIKMLYNITLFEYMSRKLAQFLNCCYSTFKLKRHVEFVSKSWFGV